MFYTNADQALNKKDDLLVMISVEKPDIIILTEVIPKAQSNSIPLSQLAIPEIVDAYFYPPRISL